MVKLSNMQKAIFGVQFALPGSLVIIRNNSAVHASCEIIHRGENVQDTKVTLA